MSSSPNRKREPSKASGNLLRDSAISTSSSQPLDRSLKQQEIPHRSRSRSQVRGIEETNGVSSDARQKRAKDGHGRFASLSNKNSRSRKSEGFLLDAFADRGKNRRSGPDQSALYGANSNVNGERGLEPGRFTSLCESTSRKSQERRSVSLKSAGESNGTPTDLPNGQLIGTRGVYDEEIEGIAGNESTQTSSAGTEGTFVGRQSRSSKHQSLGHESATRRSAIDSADIVRMALNLNESRKMNLEPGHLASVPAPETKLSSSATLQPRDAVLAGSLRQHLQAQSRSSQNSSPIRGSPNEMRSSILSPSPPSSSRVSSTAPPENQPEYIYHLSPATISRAERAKAFFELANEHRRLLEYLPPLKPHHGSTILGRQYNPLQYLRNRRARVRERTPLDPEASGWNDVLHVRNWVDLVEQESDRSEYLGEDVALLPEWRYLRARQSASKAEDAQNNSTKETKVVTRSEQSRRDWKINPSDLLADAYWLEEADHKVIVESRQGHKIYPRVRRPLHPRASFESIARPSEPGIKTYNVSDSMNSPESPKETKQMTSPTTGETDQDTEIDDGLSSPHDRSKRARMKRHLLKRQKALSYSSDDLSASETESTRQSPMHHGRHAGGVNTGPLERHMRDLLEIEASSSHDLNHVKESDNDDPRSSVGGGRRLGISEETHKPVHPQRHRDSEMRGVRSSLRNASQIDLSRATPQISIHDFDGAKESQNVPKATYHSNGHVKLKETHKSKRLDPIGLGLNFRRRNGSKDRPKSAYGNRGDHNHGTLGFHSEIQTTDGETSHRGATGAQSPMRDAESGTDPGPEKTKLSDPPATRRFFKGGRIGEIVRHEGAHASDIAFKVQASRRGSATSISSKDLNISSNEERLKPSRNEQQRPLFGSHRRRSASTNDLHDKREPQYHIQNLPSFVSSSQNKQPSRPLSGRVLDDHITRQQEQRKFQQKTSRFESLAPSPLDTSDVSPINSSPDLSRSTGADPDSLSLERFGSYGFLRSTSQSHSRSGVMSANSRLQSALEIPRSTEDSSASVTPRDFMTPSTPSGHRTWRTANGPTKSIKHRGPSTAITERDIAYVRGLLLSSGVKGKLIVERANTPRSSPAPYLLEALASADETDRNPRSYSLDLIPRRQEHGLAAKNLSKQLNATAGAFESAARHFRADTCAGLTYEIGDLRERVGSQLTPRVRAASDDADAFIARLTTTHTLAIKQVNDSVDQMMRKRRQRLRWLRRVGFAMLEWVLVALMWWIWLFVFLFKCVRTVFTGFFRGLRWLLWL